MNDHTTRNAASGTPEELRPIEAALERLAGADRDSAPIGFEDRVTAAALTPHEPEQRAIPIHRRRPRRRVLPHAVALAATIAVVGIAWLAMNPPSSPTTNPAEPDFTLASLEQDVDDLLALDELLDELGGPDTALATERADEIDDMLSQPWELIESLDTALSEESI